MNETKRSQAKPKKFLGGSVGLAVGIICILLIASLGGVIAYYTMTISSKDNKLNSLGSEVSQLNATVNQLNATITEQNNTINSLNAELQMGRDGDVSPQTAYVMENSGVLFVDVRTPDEYDIMHINNSINIPYYNMTDFATRLAPLAGKQNTQMVLYCRTGVRSLNAWLYLNSTGYTQIYNMLGGINAWRAMNYSVWQAPSGPITLGEARWMVDLGQGINGTFPNLIIIDVRDSASYTGGHLPNATNIPYVDDFSFNDSIMSPLSGKENSTIVVYCAGGGCELSSMAASVLIEDGFNYVYWMPDGFSGWQAAGYLVVTPSGTTGTA
jgi:rhodanese-related sulfurtransferase/outer membrane murein-binding lipoprotein Lpp